MHEFIPGMVARAEEVNDNFAEVMNAKDSDNEIVIKGKRYPRTGILERFPAPSFRKSGDLYAASISITPPFTPPTGFMFLYYIARSTGFTVLANGSIDDKTGMPTVRVLQAFSDSSATLKAIGWTLVKEFA